MICKLPVWYKGKDVYKSVELKKPTASLIAEVKDSENTSNVFMSMRNFVAGCTERIIGESNEISDPIQVKGVYDASSIKNLEYLTNKLIIWYNKDDDYVEGIYECPRCHLIQIAEKKIVDGIEIETRDRISDLKVNFMESENQLSFFVEFSKPYKIMSDNGSEEISSIDMIIPTTKIHVESSESIPMNKSGKLQLEIFAKSIVKANSQDVDDSWRRSKGRALMGSIDEKEDLNKISDSINQLGVIPFVNKICKNKNCGKEWKDLIETRNFFVSAL